MINSSKVSVNLIEAIMTTLQFIKNDNIHLMRS
jgi:hypothetical protein